MIKAVYAGTNAMIANDGSATNEDVFWKVFCGVLGEAARGDEPHFDAFYRHEFQQVQLSCGFDARAADRIPFDAAVAVMKDIRLRLWECPAWMEYRMSIQIRLKIAKDEADKCNAEKTEALKQKKAVSKSLKKNDPER